MAIHPACYVVCDECHNLAEISVDGAVVARRLAKAEGFVRERVDGKMKDLCERCAGMVSPERRGRRMAISDMQRQNRSGG